MIRALAFFGAFNPPTTAHLSLALLAMEKTGREQVVFVPSKASYIRDEQGKDRSYSDACRLQMLRAAAAARPWMRVTDWEMRQESQPRTYRTLCHLREEGIDAALLLGSDKLPELEHGWRHVREIAEEFGIVCLARDEDDCGRMIREDPFLRSLSGGITVVETPEETKHISSSRVRALLAAGNPAAGLGRMVPEEILALLASEE